MAERELLTKLELLHYAELEAAWQSGFDEAEVLRRNPGYPHNPWAGGLARFLSLYPKEEQMVRSAGHPRWRHHPHYDAVSKSMRCGYCGAYWPCEGLETDKP